jgi:hypothetical protein
MVLVGSVRSVLTPLDLECGPLGSEYDDQVGYALIVVRIVLEDEAARKAFLDPGYESALVVTFEHGVYPRIKNYTHGWPGRRMCRYS